MVSCTRCHSNQTVKNGKTHSGTQSYRCRHCGKQFVLNPKKGPIPRETKEIIHRMLFERVSLAGIARVTGVSERWLQTYVNETYEKTSKSVSPAAIESLRDHGNKKKIEIQGDELWSFVGKKKIKQWVWLAIEKESRVIVGVYIGDRGGQAAKNLWNNIPEVLKERCLIVYTDFWKADVEAVAKEKHLRCGKETGLTNYIERFNNTLRQRCSRLVRMALSFSKKIENHIGAIWLFIHHYNETKLS